jgi:hypothetical protein
MESLSSSKSSLVPLFLLVTFVGCLISASNHSKLAHAKIPLTCKTLTEQECITYLGKHLGKNVIRKGYRPIQIIIENNSGQHLKFSSDNISLRLIPMELVAKKICDNSTSKHAAGFAWKFTSFFMPALGIPGSIHSMLLDRSNNKVMDGLITKSATDRIIDPNSRFEGILFVHANDYHDNWTLALTDANSHETIMYKINADNTGK